MKKQYIAIIRDHSGSMGGLVQAAKEDYNTNLAAIKEMSQQTNIETLLTVVQCGIGRNASVVVETENRPIQWVDPIYNYEATGGSTPLFDSIGRSIEVLEGVHDKNDADVSFLVLAVTDGEDNRQLQWNTARLKKKIQELQGTDHWTFAFRVPRGHYKQHLMSQFGISGDNILEWEQTNRGVQESSQATTQAYSTYYAGRTRGVTSSQSFFTDLTKVTTTQVQQTLNDITHEVTVYTVKDGYEGESIRGFIEKKMARSYIPGTAFYQLVKSEKIQDNKQVILKDKNTGKFWSGTAARATLGLNSYGEVRVKPGNHGNWDVFVQSRSVNRILPVGTVVAYWPNVH